MIDTKTLKLGDNVAATRYNYGNPTYEIHKVTKVTPTGQVTIDNGWRFNNEGHLFGSSDSYNRMAIVGVTDEILEKAHRQRLLMAIRHFKEGWLTLPTEALRQIAEIIRDNKGVSSHGD